MPELRLVTRLVIAACLVLVTTTGYAQRDRSTEPTTGIRFQPPTAVALLHATVVVDPQTTLEDATILIEDGRIQRVGAQVQIPPGYEVIDCEGDWIYPAWVEPLLEIECAADPSNLAHWNAQIRPEVQASLTANVNQERVGQLRQAGFGAALLAPEGGIMKGQSCIITLGSQDLAQSMLATDVAQHIRLYPERGSRGSYPNSPMGAMALVRLVLSDAAWYRDAQRIAGVTPGLNPPARDAALEALQPLLAGQQVAILDGSNELYALRCDRIAREFGLRAIVRGSGREYRRLDQLAATGRALILPLDFPDAPRVRTVAEAADASLQELMHWYLAPENPARVQRAGIPFAFTSDQLEAPKEFLNRVRLAVKHGLEPTAALAALTTQPAELLGIGDQVGTVSVGKLANLVRATGDVMDAQTKVKETWVRGEPFRWEEQPEQDLRGTWDLGAITVRKRRVRPVPHLPHTVALEVTGPGTKLAAAFVFPPAATEAGGEAEGTSGLQRVALKDLQVTDWQLTGTFPAKELRDDQSGRAILHAVPVQRDAILELEITIVWPDGSRQVLTGRRRSEDASSDRLESSDADQAAQEEKADGEADRGASQDGAAPTESDTPAERSSEESTSRSLDVEVVYPLGVYGRRAPPAQPEWLVIRHATIWTCGPRGVLRNADMLIHNGIIEAVGRNLKAPDSAVEIDAKGKHVSPGIIDCHSHMATDGGVNESGQAVTAEVRIGDFIDPNDITIYRQLAGGVTTANILHGSANPIGGQNQVIKLRWGASDEAMKMAEAPAGIKFALGENVKQSNWSQPTGRYPQTRMGVEQIMRDRFEAALQYRDAQRRWEENHQGLPPRRDYELEAIAEILEGRRWIHCHSYRQDEILTMLRVLEDYGVTIGSLQHILEGYKVADAMARHGATGSSFSDWWAYKFEVYDAIPYNGALMHRAGVIVSFNSDDDELARHLNHEAAKAIKYGGVPPQEALKFVTLNPARQLRIDQWVGSLEPGKQADFVIWSDSPLSTMSACLQTWIEGRKYFDREEDLRRREDDERLRQQLIQHVIATGAKPRPGPDDSDPSYWWARHDEFCHHRHDEHDHSE